MGLIKSWLALLMFLIIIRIMPFTDFQTLGISMILTAGVLVKYSDDNK